MVDIEREKRRLTEGFLSYFNTQVAEICYFDKPDSKLGLHCPGCNSDYTITKSMYDAAKAEFVRKEKIDDSNPTVTEIT